MRTRICKIGWATVAVLLLAVSSWAEEKAAAAPATPAASTNGPEITVTPVLHFVHVDGDKSEFRQNVWMDNGLTGGVEEFTLRQQLNKDTVLDLSGRGIYDEGDYKLRLDIVKKDVGFVRAGFTQWRRYYDNRGGYYQPYSTRSSKSGKDLDLDIGNIFVDVGLTLPDIPKLTLGYERQYKQGKKSMLEWGSVTETLAPPAPAAPSGSVTKKIYPSYKDIDETVDIFKFDLEHTIKNIDIANQFRYESYNNDTRRSDAQFNITTSASKSVQVKEEFKHDNFSNVFQMESWCTDKTYWSAGYLFSTLHGGGGLNVNTIPYSAVRDKEWFTRDVTVKQDSHVVNLNMLFGPYADVTGYVGIQAETTTTDGDANGVLTEFPDPIGTGPDVKIRSNNDNDGIEETLGVRYVGIPFTTLYAEGRWAERGIDLNEKEFENGSLAGPNAFKRDTDTTVFRQQYTGGFNSSPIRNVTWSGRYRRTMNHNYYDNDVDTTEGYPAFLRRQEFDTDDVSTKLTLRPHAKVVLALKYQLVATKIHTKTDSVPTLSIPKGSVESGDYNASIYSFHVTLTPIPRMYLRGSFTYDDTSTSAYDHNAHSVVTYHGNVYTIIATAGYAIDNKTDLTVEYSISKTDNSQNNGSDNTPKAGYSNTDYGLPLGLDNEIQAVSVGIARRFTENITGRLRNGFYTYRESSNGHKDDYSAYLASASCSLRF
jgi:hypothetical protein